jgi:hypothetical protein
MSRAVVGGVRGGVVLACLAWWVGSASAGPGVIVASRAEVLEAPSEAASLISEIGRGGAVCVLDESNYAGVVHHRPGWVAIRIPGIGGVGYVRIEAVALASTARPPDPTCGESVSMPGVSLTDPATAPAASVTAPAADLRRWQANEPSTVQARSSVRAGRLLPLHPVRIMLGLGTGTVSLAEQSAVHNHITDSGPLLNFSAALTIYDVFSISFAGGGAFPSDNASFSEQVVPEQGGGAPTTADSSLSVSRLSIAVGLRTPFLALIPTEHGWFAGALYADYGAAVIGGSRSISNCVDCRSEDLDFPGDTFWRVGLDLAAPSFSPQGRPGRHVWLRRHRCLPALPDRRRADPRGPDRPDRLVSLTPPQHLQEDEGVRPAGLG